MKLIKPSTELINQPFHMSLDSLKHIEKCGRVCYKSEDKITEDSAVKFVQGIIKSGHESVLEHLWVNLKVDCNFLESLDWCPGLVGQSGLLKYLAINDTGVEDTIYISGNVRAFRDAVRKSSTFRDLFYRLKNKNKYLELLLSFPKAPVDFYRDVEGYDIEIINPKDMADVSDYDILCHTPQTVRFICDRGVSHELVRHRELSFSQESTRYCNYGEGGEITFIIPPWVKIEENTEVITCAYTGKFEDIPSFEWASHMRSSKAVYNDFINDGMKPQDARSVLPNSLKTEVVVTGSLKQWVHFFNLRALGTTGKPHPQMIELAEPLLEVFYVKHPFIKGYVGK